jgi:hypothetical protein
MTVNEKILKTAVYLLSYKSVQSLDLNDLLIVGEANEIAMKTDETTLPKPRHGTV